MSAMVEAVPSLASGGASEPVVAGLGEGGRVECVVEIGGCSWL